MRLNEQKRYVGIHKDQYGGMTDTGKIVREAWIFGLIPETETCEGWLAAGIQSLWEKVNAEWEKYDFRVNGLPPDIRERFDRIQGEWTARARNNDWDPDRELIDEK